MPDLGPLNAFICWQTALFSIGIAVLSGGIKTIIDTIIGHYSGATEAKSATGRAIRRNSKLITRAVLPGVPIILGAICALFVPLTPDILVKYISTVKNGWMILMFYGAACGVVADYAYNHFKKGFVNYP